MRKNARLTALVVLTMLALIGLNESIGGGVTFTDIPKQCEHRTGLKLLRTTLDANFALLEGQIDVTSPYELWMPDTSSTNKGVFLWGSMSAATNMDDNARLNFYLFRARDDGGTTNDFANIIATVTDTSTSSKDSMITLQHYVADTLTDGLSVGSSGTVLAGPLDVQSGVITLANDETIDNATRNGEVLFNGIVGPAGDNAYDLGSSTNEWKDAYVDGTVYADDMSVVDATFSGTVTMNNWNFTGAVTAAKTLSVAGETTLDNTIITGTLACAETLDVQGGDITLQNDETINNSRNGEVLIGGILGPVGDNTYDFGSSTNEWKDGYFDGVLNIDDAVVSGSATVDTFVAVTSVTAPDVDATDDLSVTDDATIGGLFVITPTAITVTNGQEITVADSVYLVTSSGANDGTNTCTLHMPDVPGKHVEFIMSSAASNTFELADTGNLKLSSAFDGKADDTITLRASTTNVWNERFRSDN